VPSQALQRWKPFAWPGRLPRISTDKALPGGPFLSSWTSSLLRRTHWPRGLLTARLKAVFPKSGNEAYGSKWKAALKKTWFTSWVHTWFKEQGNIARVLATSCGAKHGTGRTNAWVLQPFQSRGLASAPSPRAVQGFSPNCVLQLRSITQRRNYPLLCTTSQAKVSLQSLAHCILILLLDVVARTGKGKTSLEDNPHSPSEVIWDLHSKSRREAEADTTLFVMPGAPDSSGLPGWTPHMPQAVLSSSVVVPPHAFFSPLSDLYLSLFLVGFFVCFFVFFTQSLFELTN